MTTDIIIRLIVTAVDLVHGTPYIVVVDEKLPSQILLQGKNIEEVVHELCVKYIHLDSSWINPKCFHAEGLESNKDNQYNVFISYVGQIPLDTKLLNRASFSPASNFPQNQTIMEALRT